MRERTNAWGDSVFPGERGYSYADEYPRGPRQDYITDELQTVPPFDAEKMRQWGFEAYKIGLANHAAYHAEYGQSDGCFVCELFRLEGEQYADHSEQ